MEEVEVLVEDLHHHHLDLHLHHQDQVVLVLVLVLVHHHHRLDQVVAQDLHFQVVHLQDLDLFHLQDHIHFLELVVQVLQYHHQDHLVQVKNQVNYTQKVATIQIVI